MASYCKVEKWRRYVSYDGGVSWKPLEEYKQGELISEFSADCGGGKADGERWVQVELSDGYYCCDCGSKSGCEEPINDKNID